ncbi:hypothetical protein [Paracraurococcus lichenis]|uniref:Uncharacterized protein n=1 Tax=Paracraurococcus lichenis TaxID=3064888 RepID=A0ABT9DYB2_9PROT|nr:hypothetical protein [Paracraurococcus sp. LOR1-02]MDO9708876.1 hypothetical protein [Paracraurococcus sp. LOR1-02]
MRAKADLLAHQRQYLDDIFSLTDGEAEARRRFEEMAIDTIEALLAADARPVVPFYIDPSSAFCWSETRWQHHLVSPELVERWIHWKADYPALQARNPKLDLHDALGWCAETHDAASWPYGWERWIYDWVASGDFSARPFSDGMRIVTADFYARLRRLQAAVDGWLVWSEEAGRVVHVPGDEWGRRS